MVHLVHGHLFPKAKEMLKPIAKSDLWMGKSRGERRRITISIAKPEKDPLKGGNYRCLATIRGLKRKRYIYGIDSLQSLMLATFWLKVEINVLKRQGSVFFMSKTGRDKLEMPLIWGSNDVDLIGRATKEAVRSAKPAEKSRSYQRHDGHQCHQHR